MTDPSTLDWFHGRITRDTAEKNLAKTSMKDGTYLLRESTQHIGSYVLSVCKDKKVKSISGTYLVGFNGYRYLIGWETIST